MRDSLILIRLCGTTKFTSRFDHDASLTPWCPSWWCRWPWGRQDRKNSTDSAIETANKVATRGLIWIVTTVLLIQVVCARFNLIASRSSTSKFVRVTPLGRYLNQSSKKRWMHDTRQQYVFFGVVHKCIGVVSIYANFPNHNWGQERKDHQT